MVAELPVVFKNWQFGDYFEIPWKLVPYGRVPWRYNVRLFYAEELSSDALKTSHRRALFLLQ
jgi:hypothetical protein